MPLQLLQNNYYQIFAPSLTVLSGGIKSADVPWKKGDALHTVTTPSLANCPKLSSR